MSHELSASTDINRVELRGRICQPPRMLDTKRGPLCRLSVATSDKWYGPQDTWQCTVTHHEVAVWAPALIERIRERGVKDARIHLTGRMIRRRDFKDGHHHVREIEIDERCGDIDIAQPVVDTAAAWTGASR